MTGQCLLTYQNSSEIRILEEGIFYLVGELWKRIKEVEKKIEPRNKMRNAIILGTLTSMFPTMHEHICNLKRLKINYGYNGRNFINFRYDLFRVENDEIIINDY